MVEERLAEAASVLGRLPPMRVYSYSTWPRLLVDYSSMVHQRSGPLRLPPPDPAAIGRMEEALDWSAWLKPTDRGSCGSEQMDDAGKTSTHLSAWREPLHTSTGATLIVSSRVG
jgi:hypothetical protein